MATLDELTDIINVKKENRKMYESLFNLEKQNFALNMTHGLFFTKNELSEDEQVARYGLGDVLNKYIFMSSRYIYHSRNFLNSIFNCLSPNFFSNIITDALNN